ncbi:ABC transporter substrate-binding protein [Fonticella tunisiensis]|uniref:Putative ABC transport system substrate-binding protein n=1 Tax=Fonticella tunisiensis TaxID=1096341 RepID=A0A4V3ETF0_9CLOT|nr:ABC transporter substrate-binding protein [Fonticella tunisiensis]TDT61347.1 putative ABC transport system substrate-binding protein [Fonticella tunisiensis]
MVGKNIFKITTLIVLLASFLMVSCSKVKSGSSNSTQDKIVKIGISQLVEHPALDSARKGFIDALKSKGFKDGNNIEIDFQNAQGDIPTSQTIAQNFVSEKKDMILAIATPAAQAAFNATKDIPILITAVTDPVSAGLVKSMEKSETNVTGTSDAAPIEKQFELIKKLVPNAKKVGILYNTSESNSEVQAEQAKKIAPDFGFEIVTSGITNVNDISQALEALLKKVDVLYAPTDNVIASSMALISSKCVEAKIPVIAAEAGMVNSGALATEGIDYYNLGFQTGLAAVEVINGKRPQDMPVTTLKDTKLIINTETADKLGITIPQELKDKAELVKGGK